MAEMKRTRCQRWLSIGLVAVWAFLALGCGPYSMDDKPDRFQQHHHKHHHQKK